MGLGNCYAGMWNVVSNSLDIDFIDGDIHVWSYRKDDVETLVTYFLYFCDLLKLNIENLILKWITVFDLI